MTRKFLKLGSNFFVVLVLLLSIVAGVLLVAQSQDIRNKAKEMLEQKVSVCHKTGSDTNPWQQIEVSENALKAHLDHGDILGSCPSPEPTSSNEGGGTGGSTNINVNVNVGSQGNIAQGPTLTPTLVPYTGPTKLVFKIKFEGIEKKAPDKKVKVILRQGGRQMYLFENVNTIADPKGVYRGEVQNIASGVYEVLIKGDVYLQKKFTNVRIVKGINNWNWISTPLIVGGFDSNNTLDSYDIALILSEYVSGVVIGPENEKFDVNSDSELNLIDINIVLENLTEFVVLGDD